MNNKTNTGAGNSTGIVDSIRRIALQGIADPDKNVVFGAKRVTGYVAKINDNKTVDVQEYLDAEETKDGVQEGYHEGVWLSALESNPNGYLIVPKLYSEVVIAKDPVTLTEYVVMYSHVDIIQLEASESVTVGVVEREELDLDDDGSPDVDELEATGVYGKTSYSKDEVRTEAVDEENGLSGRTTHTKEEVMTEVVDEDGGLSSRTTRTTEEVITEVVDDGGKSTTLDMKSNSFDLEVSDGDDSTMHMDKSKIELERGKSKTTLKDSENTMENGNEKVKVTNSVVYVGNDSNTSHAVLGEELADILMDILGYCSDIKTTTILGPQPVLPPTIMQFIALKAKIAVWKSTVSNFLTRKVEVQK